MELTKHPETEMQYWEVIEGIGGYIWSTEHALSHGRIPDPKGEVSKSIQEARGLQLKIVSELPEKFGVILPKDCPSVAFGEQAPPAGEGKIYYWDWYKKMKTESFKIEYEGIICSVCPFSEGLDDMVRLGGNVPCKPFSGCVNRLSRPYVCAMVYTEQWTEGELYDKVLETAGAETLSKFIDKEKSLKEDFDKRVAEKK